MAGISFIWFIQISSTLRLKNLFWLMSKARILEEELKTDDIALYLMELQQLDG